MNPITRICIFLMILGTSVSLSAQKVGFANLEAVLALHPDMKKVNESVNTFGAKLQEQLKIKQDYAQMKYGEFLEKQQTGAEQAELEALGQELQKLQGEIQQYSVESQQKMAAKRQDEMAPVFDVVQTALNELAEAEGFDMVINAVDGTGLSVVLYGPEDRNLTKKLMERLGIEIPETASAGN